MLDKIVPAATDALDEILDPTPDAATQPESESSMADTKTTALTAATVVDADNDYLPIVDVSDATMAGSGTTKKVSPATLVDEAASNRVKFAANVAGLASVRGLRDGDVAQTRGYNSGSDGGANRYRWVAGDSTTADGGFVITGTGGRWHAIDKQVADVRKFGAVGDGSTDDYSAIQAAANACKGTDRLLFIPNSSSTYRCGTQLDLTLVKRIRCDGKIKMLADANGCIIGTTNNATTEASYYDIQLRIEGTTVNTAGTTGVTVRGLARSDVRIESNFFDEGVKLTPQSGNNEYIAFCNFWLELGSNRVGLLVNHGTFVNENCFYNLNAQRGSCTLTPGIGIHLETAPCNRNVFYKPNLEVQPTPILCEDDASANKFDGCRLENAGDIEFNDTAHRNAVIVGHGNGDYSELHATYAGDSPFPNFVYPESSGRMLVPLASVTHADWQHSTLNAGRQYFCRTMESEDAAGFTKGKNYFDWATVDDEAKSFTITNFDKGFIDIPVATGDLLQIDIDVDSAVSGGTSVCRLHALDEDKQPLATLGAATPPYLGTSRGNISAGSTNLGNTLLITKQNLDSNRVVRVNRSEVKWFRLELYYSVEFFSVAINGIRDAVSQPSRGPDAPLLDWKFINQPTVQTKTFTADAGTDTLTSTSHGLSDGMLVTLTTTDTLPAGLSTTDKYYIISAATNTFQLATTQGGSAVDITDAGSGTHTAKTTGDAPDRVGQLGIRRGVNIAHLATGGGWYELSGRRSPPSTSTDSGAPGQWAADTSHFYVYTGNGSTSHSWRRVAVASW